MKDIVLTNKGVRSTLVELGNSASLEWAIPFFTRILTIEENGYESTVERFWNYSNVTNLYGYYPEWVKKLANMLGDIPAVWLCHDIASQELKTLMSLRHFDILILPMNYTKEWVGQLADAHRFTLIEDDSTYVLKGR